MTKIRAFITGITGQDGWYLTQELTTRGIEVHGLVRRPGPDLPGDPVLHFADLGDAARVAAVVEKIKPHEIYHLGGVSSVSQSWANPIGTAITNCAGTAAILDAAERISRWESFAPRVLIASSSEVFASSAQLPMNEQSEIRANSPYGVSKIYSQNLAALYRDRGLPVTCLILFNHESPRRPEQFVTRKITKGVAKIRAGLSKELTLGNLEVRRDWGWAPDYVDAMVRAQNSDSRRDYVIATGVSHSVRDFVQAAFAAVGVADWNEFVRSDAAHYRPGEIAEQRGDPALATAELGWRASVSFEDLVERMVEADLKDISAEA